MSSNTIRRPVGRNAAAYRRVFGLVGAYVAITVLTLVAVVLLRNHRDIVNDAVWVRAIIVAASSLLTLNFAVRASRGSRRGFVGLRVISVIMPIAIVVIIALPGLFPLWMRIDQGVCGVILIALATQVYRRDLHGA